MENLIFNQLGSCPSSVKTSDIGSAPFEIKSASAMDMSNSDFARTATSFRNFVSQKPDSQFPAKAGRYHLYISYACPWASRCLAILILKGLEKAISFSSVQPLWRKTKESDEHMGWVFPDSDTEVLGADPDRLNENPSLDLYPPNLQTIIDDTNEWIHDDINNGVYKCGFATNQETYDVAVKALFHALDRCEETLRKQRFLCGNTLTETDIRLFVTLIRFDEVYAVIFKCGKRLVREYYNLFNYTKDIYQIAGLSSTVKMDHIKQNYYGSFPSLNPLEIIPLGTNIDYSWPHDRNRFSSEIPLRRDCARRELEHASLVCELSLILLEIFGRLF
ncbi:uncharacterized protein LOC17876865 isoform X3 [Capsella rubella]|uniref:uncharacterized protein LOC17876865 isoform X3 n=1 Tax=Capsella rubella TaxID=81985 RepID=UPI000CD54A85|nr:uncharacterized protein LOC17876865 isoform X3 [Capsella rubella]